MMFCVIYQFDVIEGQEADFIKYWTIMTHLIRTYEGGLGSRLHKAEDGKYLAYAQWPDRVTWENAGEHLPPEAEDVRMGMRKTCADIKTLHTMHVEADLLV